MRLIPFTKTMLEEIGDYWHDNRLRSKADAVRRLIEAGLMAESKRGQEVTWSTVCVFRISLS
jgi:hypothetical protein